MQWFTESMQRFTESIQWFTDTVVYHLQRWLKQHSEQVESTGSGDSNKENEMENREPLRAAPCEWFLVWLPGFSLVCVTKLCMG